MSTSVRYRSPSGDETWNLPNGIIHREDGPAYISADGSRRFWYHYGKLHRLEGPASEPTTPNADGTPGPGAWRLHGHAIPPDDVPAYIALDRTHKEAVAALFNGTVSMSDLIAAVTAATAATAATADT